MAIEPERTCVGCRQRAPQRELLRVVRRPSGGAAADPSGKAPGRGAYVHRNQACVAQAMERGGMGRALKVSLSPADLATLRTEIERELNA